METKYKLSIKDPSSDNERIISGEIIFKIHGPKLIPFGSLNDLPNPFTNTQTNEIITISEIGPIQGNTTFKESIDASIESMKNLLNDEIINIYGVDLKLQDRLITDIVPDVPKDEEPNTTTIGKEPLTTNTTEISKSGKNVGTFTFNVEKEDVFIITPSEIITPSDTSGPTIAGTASSNSDDTSGDISSVPGSTQSEKNWWSDLGELRVIDESDYFVFQDEDEEEFIGDEYMESAFLGEEEIIQEEPDGAVLVDQEYLNFIKTGNSESDPYPNSSGSYQIPKNKEDSINYIIKRMGEKGITNLFVQAGLLAVVSKESGFVPRNEGTYSGTSAKRIKQIFSKFRKMSDSEVDRIKKNPKEFFDIIYGGRYGNSDSEGYKYRGRGFNQLTFKGNYTSLKKKIGIDIVSDPDKLNTLEVATDALIQYFLDRFKSMTSEMKTQYNTSGDINDFSSMIDGVGAVYHANAGWGKSYDKVKADPTGGRKKTLDRAPEYYKKVSEQIT